MILGVDFGLRNVGLAISEGEIAEPYGVLRVKDQKSRIKKIGEVASRLGIRLIVVGVSEGESRKRALEFGKNLSAVLRLPVEYIDETLTTHEAQEIGRERKRGKRESLEHARSAAVILQRYLDERR